MERVGSQIVVSGVQPSGALHLGNYFGALRQNVALANDPAARDEAFVFLVNYHALTTLRDADALARYTLDAALDYLALGFDPTRAHLFVQSDVPALAELTWIFQCLTPVADLENGLAFKDKVAQGLSANAGLFAYPILQAADILIYCGGAAGVRVPVGADQKQNLEISRDVAARYNRAFDEDYFPLPEPHILDEVAVVPGTDGRKMSKSYGNTIGLFDEGAELKRGVMGIVTDSTPLEAPKDPDADNVFALIKLFAPAEQREEIAAAYRAGGYGYGHAKKALLGLIDAYFAGARERRKALAARPDYVRDVLAAGGQAARARAEETMVRVRERVGLLPVRAVILVLDNYDSFTHTLVHLVREAAGEEDVRVERNDALTVDEVEALAPAGVLISPGPGRPADAGLSVELIGRLGPTVPMLGVCLGHQALAEAFGGRVVRAPAPVHGKTTRVQHDGRTVFEGVAQDFVATRYHSLVAERHSLPHELEVSAWDSDGLVMGLRHRDFPLEGVQFHPESVLTTEGPRLVRNWVHACLHSSLHAL